MNIEDNSQDYTIDIDYDLYGNDYDDVYTGEEEVQETESNILFE